MKRILLLLLAVATLGFTASAQQKEGKTLVAYVSMTGVTAKAAKMVADVTGGELYEIAPEKAYTEADLDWRDEKSRSHVEMHNLQFRPALKSKKADIGKYDTIYLGFPIWWNLAPTLVNSFIEAHDLKGKTVIPFATSGGSKIVNSVRELKRAYPDINWKDGRLLNRANEEVIRDWVGK